MLTDIGHQCEPNNCQNWLQLQGFIYLQKFKVTLNWAEGIQIAKNSAYSSLWKFVVSICLLQKFNNFHATCNSMYESSGLTPTLPILPLSNSKNNSEIALNI